VAMEMNRCQKQGFEGQKIALDLKSYCKFNYSPNRHPNNNFKKYLLKMLTLFYLEFYNLIRLKLKIAYMAAKR